MAFYEEKISSETVYKGRIVNVRNDMARLDNGKYVPREVVEHPGGVAVIAIDANGNVMMVRQFRYPMGEELLEIPAGKLEYGEDHCLCAVRELSEETGCRAETIVYLGPIYPSPGFSQEILHIYLATDLTNGEAHPDEDELLSVEAIPLDTLVDMIMASEIKDGKTIIGILKAKEYLERKR